MGLSDAMSAISTAFDVQTQYEQYKQIINDPNASATEKAAACQKIMDLEGKYKDLSPEMAQVLHKLTSFYGSLKDNSFKTKHYKYLDPQHPFRRIPKELRGEVKDLLDALKKALVKGDIKAIKHILNALNKLETHSWKVDLNSQSQIDQADGQMGW